MRIVITHRRRSQERGDEPTLYALNVATPENSTTGSRTPVGENLHQGGGIQNPPPPWGKNSAPQQIDLHETTQQEKDPSTKKRSQKLLTSNGGGSPRGEAPPVAPSSPQRSRSQAFAAPTIRASTGDAQPTPLVQLLRHHPWATKHTLQTRQDIASAVISSPPVGDVNTKGNRPLSAATTAHRSQTARPVRDPDTSYLDTVISELSYEFHDEPHLRSNRTQARNLLSSSGLGEASFVMTCYEARSRLRAQRYPGTPSPPRNYMAYFFAILRDLLLSRARPSRPRSTGVLMPEPRSKVS
jgi:hypothetical protein